MGAFLGISTWLKVVTGVVVVVLIALVANGLNSANIIARLQARADTAIAESGGEGVSADFTTVGGWYTRHPTLHGGDDLPDDIRIKVAAAVSAVPGVGGAHWEQRKKHANTAGQEPIETGPFHCQRDVEALLSVRVIRFAQASAAIDPASTELIDEVTAALKPCRGAIIAVTGHSDAVGDASINLRLSQERAEAVRDALVDRGLPRASLRATGVGAQQPIDGLEPTDPANRRIEFSLIEIAPIAPTPIDPPDAG